MSDGRYMNILMIDDRVPFPYLGAGYPRALKILETLDSLGHTVTFVPCVFSDTTVDASRGLPASCYYKALAGPAQISSFVAGNAGRYDALWVSRPHNMAMLQSHIPAGHQVWRDYPLVVYDAEAIFSLRSELMAHYLPDYAPRQSLEGELRLAAVADVVSVVNRKEGAYFEKQGKPTVVLSARYSALFDPPVFEETRGFLFVGSLRDFPGPNTDALIWFCRRVAPLLRAELGTEFYVDVVGMTDNHDFSPILEPDVRLLGMIPDLEPTYLSHRVFIAPHRFAAGIAAKILEAASHGVPVVASTLLAEQLEWRNDQELFSAATNDAQAFAKACLACYRDETAWRRLQGGARERLVRNFSPDSFTRAIETVLAARRPHVVSGGA